MIRKQMWIQRFHQLRTTVLLFPWCHTGTLFSLCCVFTGSLHGDQAPIFEFPRPSCSLQPVWPLEVTRHFPPQTYSANSWVTMEETFCNTLQTSHNSVSRVYGPEHTALTIIVGINRYLCYRAADLTFSIKRSMTESNTINYWWPVVCAQLPDLNPFLVKLCGWFMAARTFFKHWVR